MYPDTLHTPFVYGVASADPTSNGVLLWTATEPSAFLNGQSVAWQVSSDSSFTTIDASGNTTLDSSMGYTLKIEVNGLLQDRKYFYRFSYMGNYSVTGITYTAPSGTTNNLKLGLVSCSSLFSGYFNAYRQLARLPLHGLIHVGDYIYDFVDPDEQVRIPLGSNQTLNENVVEDWRARHRLYLTDPDLREARRVFPWIHTWDNHDVIRDNPGASSRAFREFVPFREYPGDTLRIWRNVSYGNLLDVFMIDINVGAGVDTFPTGSKKAMSDMQFDWLKTGLKNSSSTWKFIGSEKFFSQWNLGTFTLPGGGLSRTWNGYPESRDSLLVWLRDQEIDNTVILSGDLHMNIWSDVALNPFDSLAYNKITGEGSIAVEIMGTSLSRGNLDEAGVGESLRETLHEASLLLNPQQRYVNLYDHGFNVVSLYPDSIVAQSYLCPILNHSEDLVLDFYAVCKAGSNHWERQAITSTNDILQSEQIKVYPNPSATGMFFLDMEKMEGRVTLQLTDMTGRLVFVKEVNASGTQPLHNEPLTSGTYLLKAQGDSGYYTQKIVVN